MSRMDSHPFRSDKDALIRDLRNQVDELAAENVRLERINRGERRRVLRKICVWTVLALIGGSTSFGITYAVYAAIQRDAYLGKRCTRLCNNVLGHSSMFGEERSNSGCGASASCACRLLSGREVSFGYMTDKELEGDLWELAKKYDFESWRKCVNLEDKIPSVLCDKVPRKAGSPNAKTKQNRMDGSND